MFPRPLGATIATRDAMNEKADRTVEQIYDALDRGEPDRAFAIAREALAACEETDPVVLALAGVSLLEMDRPEDALPYLREATSADPDDSDALTAYAEALYRSHEFSQAAAIAARAVAADPRNPDAHAIQARLLERERRFEEADRYWRRAAKLDPERYPPPVRMSRHEFEEAVARAVEELPEPFRRALEEVAILVEDVPSEDVLREGEDKLDPDILGLFVGRPLTERTFSGPGGELPPRILLFQRNIENAVADREELGREIVVTVRHELAHFLGHDEEGIEEMGLA